MTETEQKTPGEILKELRIDKGLKAKDVARLLACSGARISQIEAGGQPSLSLARRLFRWSDGAVNFLGDAPV